MLGIFLYSYYILGVPCLGFQLKSLQNQGFGFRVWGLGFTIEGLELIRKLPFRV